MHKNKSGHVATTLLWSLEPIKLVLSALSLSSEECPTHSDFS